MNNRGSVIAHTDINIYMYIELSSHIEQSVAASLGFDILSILIFRFNAWFSLSEGEEMSLMKSPIEIYIDSVPKSFLVIRIQRTLRLPSNIPSMVPTDGIKIPTTLQRDTYIIIFITLYFLLITDDFSQKRSIWKFDTQGAWHLHSCVSKNVFDFSIDRNHDKGAHLKL